MVEIPRDAGKFFVVSWVLSISCGIVKSTVVLKQNKQNKQSLTQTHTVTRRKIAILRRKIFSSDATPPPDAGGR